MSVFLYCNALSQAGKNTCVNCLRKRHSPLKDLSEDELALLEQNRYEVSYAAGEIIYKEAAKPLGLLCLKEGKVKIVRTGITGTEQIVALKKPVDFIGFRTLMGEKKYSTSAVALESSVVCVVDKNDFFKIIKNNSYLAFKIIRLFAHELDEVSKRQINLTQKHMRARLVDALLLVYDMYGTLPDDATLNVELKRADYAALANMTTANAIRMFSAFAKENLIEINQRKIKIKNFKALRDISILGR
jgi:CRP/FNR family transcriptional regulator, polysaccharide utilization system transcription regulator